MPIQSRWHDGGLLEAPPGAPARQAALAFALYGLRLQAEGISPGPIEAIVAIADKRGHPMGRLDMDALDARWMADTISAMLHQEYGPWRSEDLSRLLARYGPDNPRLSATQDRTQERSEGQVHSVDRNNAGRCAPGP